MLLKISLQIISIILRVVVVERASLQRKHHETFPPEIHGTATSLVDSWLGWTDVQFDIIIFGKILVWDIYSQMHRRFPVALSLLLKQLFLRRRLIKLS